MISGGLKSKGIRKQSQINKPLVTIITVVRNSVKTLEETILSVVNQTYPNIEYIIVEGESTDGTIDIIKKYEDRIDYWISESDKGIYDAMNKGIDLATGEWINFMNSGDTFYEKDIILKIIPCFITANDISVFYGDTAVCFDTGMQIIRAPKEIYKLKHLPFFHQSSFTKTVLLKRYHFKIKYRLAADYDFFYHLYNIQYKSQYIPITMSKYDTTGLSAKNPVIQLQEFYTINGLFNRKVNYVQFYINLSLLVIKEFIKRHTFFLLKRYRKMKYERSNT